MKRIILGCIITLILSNATVCSANKEYVVGLPVVAGPDFDLSEVKNFFREVYAQIGISVSFASYPMMRDLVYANESVIDASALRSPIISSHYPNLVQVPFPILQERLVAVTLKPNQKIESFNDLDGLTVGVMRGDVLLDVVAQKNELKTYKFNRYELGFKMLEEGRLDAIFMEETMSKLIAPEYITSPVYCSCALYSDYLYHYVNQEHANKADELAAVLEKLHKNGKMRALLGEFEKMLPNGNSINRSSNS